jgi:hypothetical protein
VCLVCCGEAGGLARPPGEETRRAEGMVGDEGESSAPDRAATRRSGRRCTIDDGNGWWWMSPSRCPLQNGHCDGRALPRVLRSSSAKGGRAQVVSVAPRLKRLARCSLVSPRDRPSGTVLQCGQGPSGGRGGTAAGVEGDEADRGRATAPRWRGRRQRPLPVVRGRHSGGAGRRVSGRVGLAARQGSCSGLAGIGAQAGAQAMPEACRRKAQPEERRRREQVAWYALQLPQQQRGSREATQPSTWAGDTGTGVGDPGSPPAS